MIRFKPSDKISKNAQDPAILSPVSVKLSDNPSEFIRY